MTLSYFVHIHYIVFLPPCFALDICIMWATSGIHKIIKMYPKGYNKTIKLIIWFAAQQLTLSQLVKSRLWHTYFMASALVVAIHRLSCQETRLQIPDFLLLELDNDFLVTCLHVFINADVITGSLNIILNCQKPDIILKVNFITDMM